MWKELVIWKENQISNIAAEEELHAHGI